MKCREPRSCTSVLGTTHSHASNKPSLAKDYGRHDFPRVHSIRAAHLAFRLVDGDAGKLLVTAQKPCHDRECSPVPRVTMESRTKTYRKREA